MKKILILGGLRYLKPVIKSAHKLGLYVITCDYLPNNVAHKYSDEYRNVNIIDKEAVLKVAQDLNIDGIMSFAVDLGVVTAAYVAEKLGLPGCPYDSVKILQNKSLFRKFLSENGFNVPKAKSFKTLNEAKDNLNMFHFPIIVKPVDSAGSKGVNKVEDEDDLPLAVSEALTHSLFANEFIIEEFIQQKGFSSDTDSFSVNSDLQFVSFNNQYFDKNAANPYTPSAYSWPSNIENEHQLELVSELRRLVKLLKLGTSIYNIEVRVGVDNKPYIMEVSPRGGGNRLAEMLKYATGQDLIENAVRAAVGDSPLPLSMPEYNGYWAEVILHSNKDGKFKNLELDSLVMDKYLVEKDLWVKPGDEVKVFNGANDAIGTLVLRFDSQDVIAEYMGSIDAWLKIIVQG